jgi:HSP20 family protein
MAIRNLVPRPFWKKDVPVRREEDNPFSVLQQDINSLFDNFFQGFDVEPFFRSKAGGFTPQVDVSENEKEIRVSAELPGMDEKDIDVSINRDSLTIRGEKREEKEDKGKDYYRMERSYGSFTRSVPLPVEVDIDKVDAKFKKGVLTVTLPKTAKAVEETKKISVKVE